MIWLLEMLGVAAACAGVDFLWVRYQQAVAGAAPWRAAGYSAAIRVASSVAVLVLVADHWAIGFAAAGDAAGTWLATNPRFRPGGAADT